LTTGTVAEDPFTSTELNIEATKDSVSISEEMARSFVFQEINFGIEIFGGAGMQES
jgi:hypothetical protein